MVHGVFPQNGDDGGGGAGGGGDAGGGGGGDGGGGGGGGRCCDVWCSFDTSKIAFSPKDEKKLRIFGKIFFGNVTQHCIGKCSKLLGK